MQENTLYISSTFPRPGKALWKPATEEKQSSSIINFPTPQWAVLPWTESKQAPSRLESWVSSVKLSGEIPYAHKYIAIGKMQLQAANSAVPNACGDTLYPAVEQGITSHETNPQADALNPAVPRKDSISGRTDAPAPEEVGSSSATCNWCQFIATFTHCSCDFSASLLFSVQVAPSNPPSPSLQLLRVMHHSQVLPHSNANYWMNLAKMESHFYPPVACAI